MTTPREGIHSLRIPILDIAAVDTVATIAGAYGISRVTGWSFPKTTIGLFGVAMIAHHLFHVETKVMELVQDTKYNNGATSEWDVQHGQIKVPGTNKLAGAQYW